MSIVQSKKNLLTDPSLWLLVFSNLVTIFFAVKEGWDVSTILWIYWFQSVIIGFFNVVRILQLQEFSVEGVEINGHPAKPTQRTKNTIAFFFLVHYGLFHVVYCVFLLVGTLINPFGRSVGPIEWKVILLTALLFFVNHLFSYFYNRPTDTKKQNIGSLMGYPYLRIFPMHFTIIVSFAFANALLFFLVLKTICDCLMHIVEHQVIRKGEP